MSRDESYKGGVHRGRGADVETELVAEYQAAFDRLRQRPDFKPVYDDLLGPLQAGLDPQLIVNQSHRPIVGLYCLQVPLEIFHALGIHPIRLCSGSLAAHRLSGPGLPALACPLIKSCVAGFYREESLERLCDLIVVPTTCDWNAKLPELIGERSKAIHVMELPRVKDSERGRRRWIEEVYALTKVLESRVGRTLDRRRLQESMAVYAMAWKVFNELIELRRTRSIPGPWFTLLANAFMLDGVESWTDKARRFCEGVDVRKTSDRPSVFLAGSPVCFPYLKIIELIETAGMDIVADELCTSERILSGVSVCDDTSMHGVIKALAERSHLGCSCPTYTDNDRRASGIMHAMRTYGIQGCVYHVLKGCHPYEIESFRFEEMLKHHGLRFIKIETGYAGDDRQSILTRLEAFRETIE